MAEGKISPKDAGEAITLDAVLSPQQAPDKQDHDHARDGDGRALVMHSSSDRSVAFRLVVCPNKKSPGQMPGLSLLGVG